MTDRILVLAESWRGEISTPGREALALGRALADSLGARLEAALLGHGVRALAGGIREADAVIVSDDPALAAPVPQVHAATLAAITRARAPRAILVPGTNLSADLAWLLAASLEAPLVNTCTGLRAEEGRIAATCLLYGGKMEVSAAPAREPAVCSILPGAVTPPRDLPDRVPAVEDFQAAPPLPAAVRFLEYLEAETGDVDITRMDALVAVGRGIQNQDNLALAEELAEALGGAVCASRPLIDQGWVPLSRQVGKSGMNVHPKLYLAFGISGAPEHTEGMKGSELIIAVNTDPRAPIFEVAHHGFVGDALEILPALTGAIQARR